MANTVLAQNSTTTTNTPTNTTAATTVAASAPQTSWLNPFDKVKIDGPMNVVFKKTDAPNSAKIIYDTKGSISSKFKFNIDKKGVLTVSEKSEAKRTTVTDVTIYYHSLRDLKIAHAKATFDTSIESTMFDIVVSGGATVTLDINALDIAVECTGASRLTLSGATKYLTMRASTAKVNCSDLSTVCLIIDASNSAEVRLDVSEKLEATTTTSAKVFYKGRPIILRDHSTFFGGDIININ